MATETRITSEQGKEAIYQAHLSKDAIEKIEGLKASASEIDENIHCAKPFLKTGDSHLSVIAFGDSITATGQAPGTKLTFLTGYWVQAHINTKKNFVLLDGKGVSGERTDQLLLRMSDILSSGADICLLHIGTNDLFANIPTDTIVSNYINICEQLTNAGIFVVTVPVLHRDNFDISIIDLLNSKYNAYSKINKKVHFLESATREFNKLLAESPLNVTRDGLHPNSYGASLVGRNVARFLDDNFNSYIIDNIINTNPFLSGIEGTLKSSATGFSPTGYTCYYSNYKKVKTKYGEKLRVTTTPTATIGTTENSTIALIGAVPIVGKKYIIEVKVKFYNLNDIDTKNTFLRLLTSNNTSHDIILDTSTTTSTDLDGNAVDYSECILKTPVFECLSSIPSFNVYFTIKSKNTTETITDIFYIKVIEF